MRRVQESAVQSKGPAETQIQFDQLLSTLNVPLTLSVTEKISRLLSTTPQQLLDTANSIQVHQFQPRAAGGFILPTIFSSFDNGEFARKLLARNLRLILGECADERSLYSVWYPPKSATLAGLHTRLIADYPEQIVDTVIATHYPHERLTSNCTD
ncbi:hypothetical protein N7510_006504 [Penicillium lagena]|uniref:uncharacterized protein n=1 Tax=Penicillium lagena TaxID=94218 RepID=UPI0025408D26|nr:uncharacterized protein N7510_006504 [Penicillium lagena]KAJ5613310.1 hypothetical protein N7510_006504 [Penicillium lagena]